MNCDATFKQPSGQNYGLRGTVLFYGHVVDVGCGRPAHVDEDSAEDKKKKNIAAGFRISSPTILPIRSCAA